MTSNLQNLNLRPASTLAPPKVRAHVKTWRDIPQHPRRTGGRCLFYTALDPEAFAGIDGYEVAPDGVIYEQRSDGSLVKCGEHVTRSRLDTGASLGHLAEPVER